MTWKQNWKTKFANSNLVTRMPKQIIVVDYRKCDPERCEGGICQAALVCEKKILFQEAPYEMPETRAPMCLGCAACLQECPADALLMM